MFYTGDLQSAIKKAVQESKLVACFVTDNSDESQLWENDFLQDQTVKGLLLDQSVLLRLEAGSTEAGYLTAIFPITKTPTFVVIQNGQFKINLTSGIVKEEFLQRIVSTLRAEDTKPSNSSLVGTTSEAPSTAASLAQPPPQAQSSRVPDVSSSSNLGDVAEDDEIKTSKPQPKVSNKQSTLSDQNYALMLKKRQDRDERARILKRVEDDKINRRNEAARRKAERDCRSSTPTCETAQINSSSSTHKSSSCSTSSLLIRLFDGSTIRNKFPSTATLSDDVRSYISKHQPALSDQPYVFKHVLSPLPNRTIEAAEETQSLQDLGCVPSATLIMAPINVYTDAYSSSLGVTASDLVGGALNSGWGLVRGGLGIITGTLGSVLGSNNTDNRGESYQRIRNDSNSTSQLASTMKPLSRIGGLDENNRVDEPQFYNGNSVNFQPRPKDNDDEDRKQN